MPNIKKLSKKYHTILGIIFALPLLLSSVTAVLYIIFDEFFHNEELAEYVMEFHTLEIIGLKNIYPFIFLIGVIGLIITGFIILKKI
jgi:hypothetical protein